MRILGIVTLVFTSLITAGLIALIIFLFSLAEYIGSSDWPFVFIGVGIVALFGLELWFNASTLRYHRRQQPESTDQVLDQVTPTPRRPKLPLAKRNLATIMALLNCIVFAIVAFATVAWTIEWVQSRSPRYVPFNLNTLLLCYVFVAYQAGKVVYDFATMLLGKRARSAAAAA